MLALDFANREMVAITKGSTTSLRSTSDHVDHVSSRPLSLFTIRRAVSTRSAGVLIRVDVRVSAIGAFTRVPA